MQMPSMGKGSGAMAFRIVQYDFTAERPDELEAKQVKPHCDSAVESRIVRGQASWRSRTYTIQF